MYSVPTNKSQQTNLHKFHGTFSTGENGVPPRGSLVGAHHHDAGAQSGVPSQGFSTGESLSLTEVNGPKGLFRVLCASDYSKGSPPKKERRTRKERRRKTGIMGGKKSAKRKHDPEQTRPSKKLSRTSKDSCDFDEHRCEGRADKIGRRKNS